MKNYRTAVVTAMSVAIVVVAAGAAVAANFGILTSATAGGTPDTGDIGSFSLASASAPDAAPAQIVLVEDTEATTTTTTTQPADVTEYAVGDAGTVTLERIGNDLRITSIMPSKDWQAVPMRDGKLVQVGFVGRDGQVLAFLATVGPDGTILTQVDDLTQPATRREHDDDERREGRDDDD